MLLCPVVRHGSNICASWTRALSVTALLLVDAIASALGVVEASWPPFRIRLEGECCPQVDTRDEGGMVSPSPAGLAPRWISTASRRAPTFAHIPDPPPSSAAQPTGNRLASLDCKSSSKRLRLHVAGEHLLGAVARFI